MNEQSITRRRFVGWAGSALSAGAVTSAFGQAARTDELRVLNPLGRVPLSFRHRRLNVPRQHGALLHAPISQKRGPIAKSTSSRGETGRARSPTRLCENSVNGVQNTA